MQRKPWAACFYLMGLIELARVMPESMAKKAKQFQTIGLDMFRLLLTWFENPKLLGTKFGPHVTKTSPLAFPMITLNVCHELRLLLQKSPQPDLLKIIE